MTQSWKPEEYGSWLWPLELSSEPTCLHEITLNEAERIKARLHEIDGCSAEVCIGGPGVIYGTVQVDMIETITMDLPFTKDK